MAAEMGSLDADVRIVHDPQPLPLRTLAPLRGAAVWRCHLDCSTPNGGAREYLLRWISRYDRVIFSMPDHVLGGLRPRAVKVVYPAIDPLVATRDSSGQSRITSDPERR